MKNEKISHEDAWNIYGKYKYIYIYTTYSMIDAYVVYMDWLLLCRIEEA